MAGRLICLIGIDGAGKTTQAHALVDDLRSAGVAVDYRYGRTLPHVTQFLVGLTKPFLLPGVNPTADFAAYTRRKRALVSGGVVARLYRLSMEVEYLLQAWIRVAIPRRLGRNLICDRYVYDTVVTDLAPDLGYDPTRVRRITDRHLRLLGRPDLIVYLRLDEATAMARKDDVPDLAYLRERRQGYDLIAAHYGMHVVPADRPVEEVRAHLRDLIHPLFGLNGEER